MNRHILRNIIRKGRVTVDIDTRNAILLQKIEVLGEGLRRAIYSRFGRSFHIREVDTGSCGACESEIIACSNPLYDIQRFGIDFVASPRHADALLVTGPLSKNMKIALTKTYESMPTPKLVITLGDCAKLGGLFKDSYYTCGGVEGVLPVVLHIPGCPPEPLTIIMAMVSFLRNTEPVK
ncbi:MAG TPA: NADH-quinone oxidoreductase subunit B family protein [Candidatus Omnitrophota bacterium]|nr:NADH-quinone oxidoreductase subunit B family protein [Candidatus Omnitrophota bacterium]